MSLISEISKLELPKVLISVLVFLGTVAPGFLLLYLYKPDLIEKLDVAKLLIFSTALTLPVLVINTFALLLIFLRAAEEGTESLAFIVGGTLVSIFAFYWTVAAAYEYSWPFVTFLSWLLGLDLCLLFALVLVRLGFIRDERKANEAKRRDS